MQTRRLAILDFWRGVAISCVIIDHLFAWLSIPALLETKKGWFIFSVAPLFFLAGVTYCLSFFTKPPKFLKIPINSAKFIIEYWRYFWHKTHKLIYAYLLAFFFINYFFHHHAWSWGNYWQAVLHFPSQFYFISIYLQLLLLAPLFCSLCQWLAKKFSFHRLSAFFITDLLILLIALLLNQWPIFSQQLWHPARLIGGGIQLWVFVSGVFMAYIYYQGWWRQIIYPWWFWWLITSVAIYALYLFGVEPYLFRHPPGFFTIVYSALLLIWLAALYHYLQFAPLIIKVVSFFGKHSLAIFLYHSFFMEELLKIFPYWREYPLWWQFVLLGVLVAILSCLAGYLTEEILTTIGKLARLFSKRVKKVFIK